VENRKVIKEIGETIVSKALLSVRKSINRNGNIDAIGRKANAPEKYGL